MSCDKSFSVDIPYHWTCSSSGISHGHKLVPLNSSTVEFETIADNVAKSCSFAKILQVDNKTFFIVYTWKFVTHVSDWAHRKSTLLSAIFDHEKWTGAETGLNKSRDRNDAFPWYSRRERSGHLHVGFQPEPCWSQRWKNGNFYICHVLEMFFK